MNWQHVRAFVWLRWRLRVNQLKKGGALNTVLLALLAVVLAGGAGGMAVGAFAAGLLIPADVLPGIRLYVWDGLVVAYLFTWAIGLINDLQRSEGLALDKFLHLPVSPAGVFLVNYLSSLPSITGILFVPAMFALALGQAIALGPASLVAVPLVLAFVFAVTAVTYQFQGWLAALMVNPRRRRTVIVFVTLGFILVFQIPNVVNLAFIRPWEGAAKGQPGDAAADVAAERDRLAKELAEGRITPAEHQRRLDELQTEEKTRRDAEFRRAAEHVRDVARFVNAIVPVGWLPLGAADAAEGSVGPALLAGLGLTLIGSVSLWRAYRTTLRLYTGQDRAGDRQPAAAPAAAPDRTRVRMVEWVLPGVSEPAAAVATAGLRSLTRAPEAKMALLTPVIFLVIFGSVFATASVRLPEMVRPLVAFAGVAFALLTAVQLTGNQFGYDRSGFRAFVLSPTPRRDILLGKNLAVAPFAVGAGVVIVAVVAVLQPMRPDHLLATLVLVVPMYLLFSVAANALSILAPIPMAAGSLKPASVKLVPVLLQMAFLLVLPAILFPLLAPLGAEVLLAELAGVEGVPVALGLTLLLAAAVVWVYRRVLAWEGDWLAAREQRILEVVTTKEE